MHAIYVSVYMFYCMRATVRGLRPFLTCKFLIKLHSFIQIYHIISSRQMHWFEQGNKQAFKYLANVAAVSNKTRSSVGLVLVCIAHNTTQLLNRKLRTPVTDNSKSASLIYTIINNQYHFVTCSDRFPVPIRSAVKSNLSSWCCRNLSKCALNAGTVKCCSGFRQFIEPGRLTQCPQGKALAALKKKLDY